MAFYKYNDEKNVDKSDFIIGFSPSQGNHFDIFARGYWNAGKTIAKDLLSRNYFHAYDAYPVVFLYRHAFELYLKSFFIKEKFFDFFQQTSFADENLQLSHKLTPLSNLFIKMCKRKYKHDMDLLNIANKTHKIAKEFEDIDSDSYGYRYPVNKKFQLSTKPNQRINLYKFTTELDNLFEEFESISLGLDMDLSIAQDIYETMYQSTDQDNGC